MMPRDVFRGGTPRTSLKVTVNGVPAQAGLALGSYAAFKQYDDGTMILGDLVLLDEEVNGVMQDLSRPPWATTTRPAGDTPRLST